MTTERLEKTIALLADLVAFPSVSGNANTDIIDYIKTYLEAHGARVQLDGEPGDGRMNLFASIGPQIDGGMILSAHTDVVPASPDGWTEIHLPCAE